MKIILPMGWGEGAECIVASGFGVTCHFHKVRTLEAPSRASILSFSRALAGSVLAFPLLGPRPGRGSSQSGMVRSP